jgi:hypothetical protein
MRRFSRGGESTGKNGRQEGALHGDIDARNEETFEIISRKALASWTNVPVAKGLPPSI